MLLRMDLELQNQAYSSAALITHHGIKVSFVNLMRFQHRARWCLMRSKAFSGVSSFSHGTILCSICKRDCYVAYLNCNCYSHTMCLRHGMLLNGIFSLCLFVNYTGNLLRIIKKERNYTGDAELMIGLMVVSLSDPRSLDLPCGSSRTLCLREDFSDIETAARKFELDDVILHEIEQYRESDDFSLLLNMFPRAEEEGYVPFCEIKFEWSEETLKTEDWVEQASNASASSIGIVSRVGSPMDQKDCLSANVDVSDHR